MNGLIIIHKLLVNTFIVRYTMFQLIGELYEWIDHHPQVIGKLLNTLKIDILCYS